MALMQSCIGIEQKRGFRGKSRSGPREDAWFSMYTEGIKARELY